MLLESWHIWRTAQNLNSSLRILLSVFMHGLHTAASSFVSNRPCLRLRRRCNVSPFAS